jgi:hypothetical protein
MTRRGSARASSPTGKVIAALPFKSDGTYAYVEADDGVSGYYLLDTGR